MGKPEQRLEEHHEDENHADDIEAQRPNPKKKRNKHKKHKKHKKGEAKHTTGSSKALLYCLIVVVILLLAACGYIGSRIHKDVKAKRAAKTQEAAIQTVYQDFLDEINKCRTDPKGYSVTLKDSFQTEEYKLNQETPMIFISRYSGPDIIGESFQMKHNKDTDTIRDKIGRFTLKPDGQAHLDQREKLTLDTIKPEVKQHQVTIHGSSTGKSMAAALMLAAKGIEVRQDGNVFSTNFFTALEPEMKKLQPLSLETLEDGTKVLRVIFGSSP